LAAELSVLAPVEAEGVSGFDVENRLVKALVPGKGAVSFKYDPFGRRTQKSGPLGTTNNLFDGVNLLAELDVNGNLLTRLFYECQYHPKGPAKKTCWLCP
jgi:hypothetical protein